MLISLLLRLLRLLISLLLCPLRLLQYEEDLAAGVAPSHTYLCDPADLRFTLPPVATTAAAPARTPATTIAAGRPRRAITGEQSGAALRCAVLGKRCYILCFRSGHLVQHARWEGV